MFALRVRLAALLFGLVVTLGSAQPAPPKTPEGKALQPVCDKRQKMGVHEGTPVQGKVLQWSWQGKDPGEEHQLILYAYPEMLTSWERHFKSPPAEYERVQVLGLDALHIVPGTRTSTGAQFASTIVIAGRYVLMVSSSEKSLASWGNDKPDWKAHDAEILEIVQDALQALADAGLILLPGQEQREGVLGITAHCSLGGVVGGVEFVVDSPSAKAPLRVVTDAFGRAKVVIPVPDASRDLKGTVTGCVYSAETRIAGQPSYVVGKLELGFANAFTLAKDKDFRGEIELRLFVQPIYVKVERTDSSDPVTDCSVSLLAGNPGGEAILRVPKWAEAPRNAAGQLELRVPVSRVNAGSPAVVLATAKLQGEQLEGWEEVNIPGRDETAAALIEIDRPDVAAQFSMYRPRLRQLFLDAGLTEAEADRLSTVQLRYGSKTNYLDGVIQLAPSATLRGSSESLLHEYGHYIADVLAPDEPEGVGIPHEPFQVVNPNAAWDEGRAHFYSALLGRALRLPGAPVIPDSPNGVENCHRRELFVMKALMEHYDNRAFFAGPAAALADFRAIHDRAKAELGRPPRTLDEFIDVAGSMPDASAAEVADLQRIRARYAVPDA